MLCLLERFIKSLCRKEEDPEILRCDVIISENFNIIPQPCISLLQHQDQSTESLWDFFKNYRRTRGHRCIEPKLQPKQFQNALFSLWCRRVWVIFHSGVSDDHLRQCFILAACCIVLINGILLSLSDVGFATEEHPGVVTPLNEGICRPGYCYTEDFCNRHTPESPLRLHTVLQIWTFFTPLYKMVHPVLKLSH